MYLINTRDVYPYVFSLTIYFVKIFHLFISERDSFVGDKISCNFVRDTNAEEGRIEKVENEKR
jgi:hypothetical protein